MTSTLQVPTTSTTSTLDSNKDDDEDRNTAMGYQQTLMYGRYSKSLGEYAKEEAKRQKIIDKKRKRQAERQKEEITGEKSRSKNYRTISKVITYVWKHTFAKLGEDWVFLAILGILMAIISFSMDLGIGLCGASRMKLYNIVREKEYNIVIQFLAWCIMPVILVLFSAGFVHVVAPQAIGSGIPEMKTIMRGVVLKEYLTAKTGLAKMVGLTATLGSGMPLGKEGPFVHIASIVATSLTKMVTTFQGIYANESRHSEMLAAACAVGVACCFASPIGGVLFSIEVTSVFFAVRNYWRGFFAAVCGATVFRLLFVFAEESGTATITAVFRTDFKVVYPYDPRELIAFAGIGVVCGMGGALYVYVHRRYVLWMRANKKLTKFLQKNRFIYPFLISFLITGLSFPDLLGQFIASKKNTHDQIHDLFSNHSWTDLTDDHDSHAVSMLQHWTTNYTDVFANLFIYILATFWLSILAATLPVPTGVLIPSFKIGAALGRMVGEGMNLWFPGGFTYDNQIRHHIVAGGYATVGAASFTGAVTHTISISVIVFEMTGQITHIIPILISVLISNGIAALLQPSCYDSIIFIKKLPYLPNILPSSSKAYTVYVEDFMLNEIKYIWYGMTYKQLRQTLKDGKKLRAFPLVDNPESMILLGSIQRGELIACIEELIGKQRRMEVANIRYEGKLKRLAIEEQMKMQQRIEEQAERQRRLAIEEQMKIKQIEEEEMAKKLKMEAEKNKLQLEQEPPKSRRPSRFGVTKVENSAATDNNVPQTITEISESSRENSEQPSEDISAESSSEQQQQQSTQQSENTENNKDSAENPPKFNEERRPSFLDSVGLDPNSPAMKALIQLSTKPKKSILKKSHSYTIHSFGIPGMSRSGRTAPGAFTDDSSWKKRFNTPSTIPEDSSRNYKTVTGAEQPVWKHALESFNNMIRGQSSTNMIEKNLQIIGMAAAPAVGGDVTDYFGSTPKIDMSLDEQQEWEEEEMLRRVEFDSCHIDPAPFQLVEKTSLLKVHNLFSMVGVNHAYVTAIGRLIGVVGLKELRAGIENVNSGTSQTASAVTKSPDTPTTIEMPKDEHELDVESNSKKDTVDAGADSDEDDDTDYSDTEMLPKDTTSVSGGGRNNTSISVTTDNEIQLTKRKSSL